MVIYQKGKTPFLFRFLKVSINVGFWVLLALGTVLFYFAGTEEPPISYGMYFVVGILALLVYLVLHSTWTDSITKIVLIEIVPTGLRIQQLKYDTLHEVIIEAGKLIVEVNTYNPNRKRKWNAWYNLKISDKDETHSFSVLGDEESIGQILDRISEQKVIELRANENDFIKKYKKNINSLLTKTTNLIVYGVRVAIVVGVVLAGYNAYKSYTEGGYISELVSAIRAYQNDEPYIENNNDANQSLVQFPKKWFPLFESEDGLIRQQLCGTEAYIEIIERDGGYIWSEQGYQDLWEGAIDGFVRDSESKYILTVQPEGGDTRQITILVVDNGNKVYSIDDKIYTPSPDSFVIKNNTDECL